MPCLIARCASNKDDHSSSDDDDFNDDDSWTFVPHECANTAHDLAPLGESAMHALVPNDLPDANHDVSRNADLLIDSGASSHMTPHRSDLLCNLERSQAHVEVADGALIKAEVRGTARIKLHDINAANQSCDVLVHNILCVPGLSRGLLSVDQLVAAGGDIHFNLERATVRVVDSDTDEARSFDAPKPFPNLKNTKQDHRHRLSSRDSTQAFWTSHHQHDDCRKQERSLGRHCVAPRSRLFLGQLSNCNGLFR
jgi:hypothetical protein